MHPRNAFPRLNATAGRVPPRCPPPPARTGTGIISIDADGHVDFVNRTAEQLLGWRGEELRGKPLLALTGARSGRALAHGSLLLTALRDGKRVRLDTAALICKGHSLLPVTCVATPRRVDGRLAGTELAFQRLPVAGVGSALPAEAVRPVGRVVVG